MSALLLRLCLLLRMAIPLLADTASVRIFTVAEDGKSIAPAQVKLVQVGSKTDYGTAFKDGLARNIPFGEYDLEVFVPGFRTYEQRLSVFRSQVTVRAAMSISVGEQSGSLSVKGNVSLGMDSQGGKETWVLAFPLVGSPGNTIQSLVGTHGEFLLETVMPGPYLLVVVQGTAVLDCRPTYIGFESPPVTIEPRVHGCGQAATKH